MDRTIVSHHSHFGAFNAVIENGRVVGAVPFAARSRPVAADRGDPRRRPFADPHRDADGARGLGAGRRRRSRRARARQFRAGVWDRALDLVAGELSRVRREHGPGAMMGGSQGWSSAGHVPRGARPAPPFSRRQRRVCRPGQQLQLRHRADLPAACPRHAPRRSSGPLTSWTSIARHSRLFVMFGGANPKNTQVAKGGCTWHGTSGCVRGARQGRGARRQHQPDPRGRAGIGRARMDRDPAEHRRRDDAGARPYAGQRAAPRRGLPRPLLHRLHPRSALSDRRGRRPAEGRRLGRAHHRRARPRRSARSRATMAPAAHDADRVVVVAARRSRRAGLLGADPARRLSRPDRAAWRRVRVRLRLVGRRSPSRPTPSPARILPTIPNPARMAIPAARIADCLLNPGQPYDYDGKRAVYPDIRLVYWAGGNPFHHHQDLNRLRRAWQKPETIIVHEPWWTATARHADIVLPATTSLERNDLGGAARDRFVDRDAPGDRAGRRGAAATSTSCAGWPAGSAARRIFAEGRDEAEWVRHLYDAFRERAQSNAVPDFDDVLGKGIRRDPAPKTDEYVMLGDFRADPDKQKLPTPSGLIELYSDRIAGFGYDDCPPYPVWIEPSEWLGAEHGRAVSRCTSYRASRATNCTARWMPGSVAARGKVGGREALAINPGRRRLARHRSGRDRPRLQRARRLFRRRGLTDAVRPGVVRLSCGAWYDPAGDDILRPRQRQCPDPRPRHLATRTGTEFGDGPGRGRALRRAAADHGLRAPSDRGISLTGPPVISVCILRTPGPA